MGASTSSAAAVAVDGPEVCQGEVPGDETHGLQGPAPRSAAVEVELDDRATESHARPCKREGETSEHGSGSAQRDVESSFGIESARPTAVCQGHAGEQDATIESKPLLARKRGSKPASRQVIRAVVDRSRGASLGIDVETGTHAVGWDGRSLLIKAVHEDGLIWEWCQANSTSIVRGDRIIRVNRCSANALELIRECQTRLRLDIVIVHVSFSLSGVGGAITPWVTMHQRDFAREPAEVSGPSLGRAWRAEDLLREISTLRSATRVVQITRSALSRDCWEMRWGAEALYRIAKHSTIVTRKAWVADRTVVKIAERLSIDVSAAEGSLVVQDPDLVIIALAALRWMEFQEPEEQRETLKAIASRFMYERYQRSVPTLARLLWLDAPLGLCGFDHCVRELRRRHHELESSDVATLAAAIRCRVMRRRAADEASAALSPGEAELLRLLAARIALGNVLKAFSAEEIADTAEALAEMRSASLVHRSLARELLVRRQELPEIVFKRARAALLKAGVSPLSIAWGATGIVRKRRGNEVATVQTFAICKEHSKRARRGDKDRDLVSVSPPRYVADWVRASY